MSDANDPKKGETAFRADFIDPLFAIAIHLGFAHGILNAKWFMDWRMPIAGERLFAGTFALGFLTLVLSWVGYHQSIKQKPLKGYGRFIIDVILVVSYAILLVKYESLDACLGILAFIYFLFFVWDLFKIYEYGNLYPKEFSFGKRYHREIVTGIWFFWFFIVWILSNFTDLSHMFLWVLAALGTVFYRVHKSKFFMNVLSGSKS